MVKAINLYRVLDRGWLLTHGLRDISEVQKVVTYVLVTRGYDEVEASSLSSDLSVFFKPNKFDVQILTTMTSELVELPRQDNEVNSLLAKLKFFNGKGLKYNSPESCKHKYKRGKYEPAEVRFAESVYWRKGQSVIFDRVKKDKVSVYDAETFDKIEKLTAQGYISDALSVEKIIRKKLETSSPTEVYKALKGNTSLSNNGLNRLIYKLTH